MTGVVFGHVVVWIALVLVAASLIVLAVARPSPRRLARWAGSRRLARTAGYVLGGIVALYLLGRAVAEFFVVDYASPASYRDSWGGPSLVGVFLVHAGPGAAVVVAIAGYLLRWWPRSRRRQKTDKAAEPEPLQRVRCDGDPLADTENHAQEVDADDGDEALVGGQRKVDAAARRCPDGGVSGSETASTESPLR